MCVNCVKVQYPDRENICLEDGAFFQNFAGCSVCHGQDVLCIENKLQSEDTEEDEETVTYDHKCKHCCHLVASHEYKFRVEHEFQEYEMNCMLCGVSEDTRSVMPYDPRQQPIFS